MNLFISNSDHSLFYGKSYEWVSARFAYNPDTGEITGPSGKISKAKDQYGYGKIQLWYDNATRKQYLVYTHRLAWFLYHGTIDPDKDIDHINGNPSDNRIANIRLVATVLNTRNRRLCTRNTSGYSGIYQTKSGKFHAKVGGHDLGYYTDLGDAVRVTEEIYRIGGYGPNHGSTNA